MTDIGLLRAIRDDELLIMLAWRNAPAVRANMYTRHEISDHEHLAWWERTRDRTDQAYFMYERDDQPLGIVGYTQIDPLNKNASWAFYASPGAPAGTGSRMELLALDHAFGSMGLNKLHCEVLDFNKAVINLHHKFGFKTEGVLRAHHLYDGKYVDIIRLGILADEWQSRRPEMLNKLKPITRS